VAEIGRERNNNLKGWAEMVNPNIVLIEPRTTTNVGSLTALNASDGRTWCCAVKVGNPEGTAARRSAGQQALGRG
jgi:hypothetical protein